MIKSIIAWPYLTNFKKVPKNCYNLTHTSILGIVAVPFQVHLINSETGNFILHICSSRLAASYVRVRSCVLLHLEIKNRYPSHHPYFIYSLKIHSTHIDNAYVNNFTNKNLHYRKFHNPINLGIGYTSEIVAAAPIPEK